MKILLMPQGKWDRCPSEPWGKSGECIKSPRKWRNSDLGITNSLISGLFC